MMDDYFDQAASDWDRLGYRHERAQAVANQLKRQVDIHPEMKVFEFGCGNGLLGFQLIADFEFVSF